MLKELRLLTSKPILNIAFNISQSKAMRAKKGKKDRENIYNKNRSWRDHT